VTVPGRIGHDAAAGWLVARVGSAEGDWGRLVFVPSAAPDASMPVLAERAATTLTLARLTRARRGETPERVAHRSVLAALAGRDYGDPSDLAARVVALGVPLAGRQLVAMVILGDGQAGQHDIADVVAAAATDLRIPAIAGNLDDRAVAALLAFAPGAHPGQALTKLAQRLRRGSGLGPTPSIGVADACASVRELRTAFRDAANAAGAAARVSAAARSGDAPLVRLADLGLAGLAFQLREDPRVLAFAERELGPLLLYDDRHGTELTSVLAAYLETGANKAETAKRCGIARPTLYERLSQIRQVLGVSLDDADRRTTLHAALLIWQLRSG
jgi:purine catabolism regulator